MTRIAERKRLEVETSVAYQGKPLVVAIEPHRVTIRQKGRRRAGAYDLHWLAVWQISADLFEKEHRRAKVEQGKKRHRKKRL